MSDTSEIIWEDPPEPGHFTRNYAALITLLRLHPGKWACLAEFPTAVGGRTTYLRKRFPDCEFVTRGRKLYGRIRPVDGDAT